MKKLPKTMFMIGRVWIWLAVSWIIISYLQNLILSNQPIVNRILIFINLWNVFVALLVILPGVILMEASEWIAKKNGYSFKRTSAKGQTGQISLLSGLLNSRLSFLMGLLCFLSLMVLFVILKNWATHLLDIIMLPDFSLLASSKKRCFNFWYDGRIWCL